MKNSRSRSGSALLVVLGILSFMIVSAVGFSAYMRYSRLPSSYLRRTAASRQLVKAALARAIDIVDRAVGSNPHPGVGNAMRSYTCPGGDGVQLRNNWIGRVFYGYSSNSTVSVEQTVPTLTLEGLAYIPPPLVNLARYWSRHSATACWQTFGYDAGRFAFTAIDVSDYFDVNRMFSKTGRSSAPQRRVSLAYLFEDGREHASAPAAGAAQWETFMDQFRTVDSQTLAIGDFGAKVPLVSMADFNLALGTRKFGKFWSPFCQYIGTTGGNAGFYNTTSEDDEDVLRRMTFVTDSILLGRKRTSLAARQEGEDEQDENELYDLANGEGQPYPLALMESKGATAPLAQILVGNLLRAPANQAWMNTLGSLGCACLYDYLDCDSVPVSLALPTVERVPMVCGVNMTLPDLSVQITTSEGPAPDDAGGEKEAPDAAAHTRTVRQEVYYKINPQGLIGLGGARIEVLSVYPFAHRQDGDESTFTLDGQLALYLTSKDMGLRTGSTSDKLHLQNSNPCTGGFDSDRSILKVAFAPTAVRAPTSIASQEDALVKTTLQATPDSGTAVGNLGNPPGILRVKYEWVQKEDQVGGIWMKTYSSPKLADVLAGNVSGAVVKEAECGWRPLLADGTPDPDFEASSLLSKLQASAGFGKQLKLNAALTLRVKNSAGKVVDLVPAGLDDDMTQNKVQSVGMYAEDFKQKLFGDSGPVMRFDTGVELDYSVAGLRDLAAAATPKAIAVAPTAVMVADPKFNHAPEDWFAFSGALDKSTWLQECHCTDGGKDGDIFMATSDQGYLQSVYELALLPRFGDIANPYTAGIAARFYQRPDRSANTIPGSFGETCHREVMWRTYDPMDADETGFNELEFTSFGTGMKVNPYSDSTNVLMAAFANTPVDWRCASTNTLDGLEELSAAEFNKKYAYCAYSDESATKIPWRDLEALAGHFRDRVVAEGDDWARAWNKLDWLGPEDELWGRQFSNNAMRFWRADKKFLYGYWRDCFAAEQQLFLIFVRAEPMLMGGDSIGSVPPQLGARAVALVWRDPRQPQDANAPHRTRLLFYKQLD